MSIPVSPDPRRSSAGREPPAGASHTDSQLANTPATNKSPNPAQFSIPIVSDDTSPTIISSNRAKTPAVDIAHAESLAGRRLGQYELIESIGVGGMAAVIKAHDLELGRIVALKILPPDMAIDPENINRFKQEARAAARLDHENVARVYNCGEDQGLHFIAFEFVEGEDLRTRMIRHGGLLPVAESVHYLMQVTAGLSHAASRGVVHRDIKPSNIVITLDGKAKIVDMGLARNLDARTSHGQITQSGVTLGTFDYISPEQAIEPRGADIRSDLYSLGCTFYHVLTGQTPVPDGTAAKKLHCQQYIAPLDPRHLNRAIPDELAAILGRMMQKDPFKRYQHPDHVLTHLLTLAEKLKLPYRPVLPDAAQSHHRHLDKLLPSPPQWSPLWLGAAALALALGIYFVSGFHAKDPLEPRPLWDTEKVPHRPHGVVQNVPPAQNPVQSQELPNPIRTPREAKSVAELVQFLKEPIANIKLKPGALYDLTKLGKKDNETAPALFTGDELVLGCDPNVPATVRMNMAAVDEDFTSRFGGLTIRGREGGACKVQFRGIRFEFVEAVSADATFVGLSLGALDQISFTDCWFIPLRKRSAPTGQADLGISTGTGATGLGTTRPTEVKFSRCYFAPGSVAMRFESWVEAKISECAFALNDTLVQIQSSDSETVQLTLEQCTALMLNGSVVELANQVPCHIQAGRCLFSCQSTEPSQIGVLIHQLGDRSPSTYYEGLKLKGEAQPNGYHALRAYQCGDQDYSFAECKEQGLPIRDSSGLMIDNPFEKDPLPLLQAFPRQPQNVFKLNRSKPELRLEPEPEKLILGTMALPGISRFYDDPLGKPSAIKPLPTNVKIWQPGLSKAEAKAPFFANLTDAINALEDGGKILVRAGRVSITPQELSSAKTDVIIQADEGYQPIFVAPEIFPTFKPYPELFKLFGGKLTFERINFILQPNRDRFPKSIVSMPSGGECTFRNCSITLEDADDLAVVTLLDPQREKMTMMEGLDKFAPTINFEKVFIRGRGDVVQVRASRTFQCKLSKALVVLDGNVLAVDANSADLAGMSASTLQLENVTTYLTKQLVRENALEKKSEVKGLGLVELQVRPSKCLFVPVGEARAPLIYLEHIDNLDQVDKVFVWKESQQNLFGYKAEDILLDVRPDGENAMQMERMVMDRWLGKWRDVDALFSDVKFLGVRPESRSFFGVQPEDFKYSINPPKEKMMLYGPELKDLAKIYWAAN